MRSAREFAHDGRSDLQPERFRPDALVRVSPIVFDDVASLLSIAVSVARGLLVSQESADIAAVRSVGETNTADNPIDSRVPISSKEAGKFCRSFGQTAIHKQKQRQNPGDRALTHVMWDN